MASKEYVKHSSKSDLLTHLIFIKGSVAGSQFLEGGCWKRGSKFFEQVEGGIAVVT